MPFTPPVLPVSDVSGPRVNSLRDNNELQVLLDSFRAIIFCVDKNLDISLANTRAREWREDILSLSLKELLGNWDDKSLRLREYASVLSNGRAILESQEKATMAGVEKYYAVDKIPASDDDGSVIGVMFVVEDVTATILHAKQLEESEARYRAFIANSTDAIWRYDIFPPIDITLPLGTQVEQVLKRAHLAEANEKMARLFGVKNVKEVLGLPLHRNGSITNKNDIQMFVENRYRMEDLEFTRIDEYGRKTWLQSSAIGIIENGFLVRAWGTTRNVTDKKRYLERLQYLANHDSLTSLPNRSLLYRTIDERLLNRKSDQKVALLLIDLDRFKEINDTLGHLAGDKVLKQIGPRLEAEMGEIPGMVARLGGDEFAIFLPNIRNAPQAAVMGHRFLDAIGQVFDVEGYHTEISASIGVAVCPDQAENTSELLRYADVAMYNAKTGLKGVEIYDPKLDPNSEKRLELVSALGRAIRENQFHLAFQPKLCLENYELEGFEALLRWEHPDFGFIPPNEFVPLAESSNLIHLMTLWVLEETVKQCAAWHKSGFDVSIAMNLSPRNLMDERIVDELAKFLRIYRVPGKMLEMEITESMLMSDPTRARLALEQINALGVRLSVDDFGTGYSSLAYLKRLPVQMLKIDGSFIQGMQDDEQDKIIVNSTIQLAHNLGLKVVAECVESEEVFLELKSLGCDYAQGYFVSKPMTALEAEAWMGDLQNAKAGEIELIYTKSLD